MQENLLAALVGILGGLSVGVQGPIANAISTRLGGASSSLVVHISGAILSGLVLMLRGGERIANWRDLPWWMWGAGAFGVILYLTISYTFPRLGATSGIALIIIGQLVAGMVIDQFGWFGTAVRPIDLTRVAAGALLLAGGYLAVR